MASARGIRAGAAYVELFLSDSKLARGLEAASRKLKAFGDSVRDLGARMLAVGAAITAPLAGAAKVFSGMGDRLAKMSDRTGIPVETLSELGFAAQLSGADLETLEKAIRKMQKTVVEAVEGSNTAAQSLAALGLSVEDLRGLTPDAMFKVIADRLAAIQGPSQRAAAALDIFGRAGSAMLPLMKDGARGIEELQEQARRLGLTMSSADARAAEAFNDTLDILGKVVKRAVFALGAALAPALSAVARWVTRLVQSFTAWVNQNRETIVTVLKVGAVVAALGAGLVMLGYAIAALGTVLGALGAVITAAGAAVGAMGTALAALLSPVGLVVVALGALAVAILYMTGLGGKALAWLGERFRGLAEVALAAFRGMTDALIAGDIGLAARILWLTLKLEWLQGVQFLLGIWLNFKGTFLKIAYGAFYGVQAVWEIVANALMVSWIELTAFASKTWTQIAASFQAAWNTAVTWVEKRLHDLHGLFDSSFDATQAKAMADQALEADNARIDRDTQEALGQREAQRRQERADAEGLFRGQMARIGQESLDAAAQIDAQHAQRLAQAQAEIDRAQAEWQEAIAEAARKRAAAEAEPTGPARPTPDSLADELLDLGRKMEFTFGASAAGSFNALAARGLGAAGPAERIARSSEETAKNTRRLVQQGQAPGAAFE